MLHSESYVNCMQGQIYIFERTALDECVSIDIAEKYKVTTLEGHNQVTKREKRKITPTS